MRRILLFDSVIDGHHADYLTHLINYWLHHQPDGELLVVTQASFESTVHQLLGGNPAADRVRFIPIPAQAIAHTHQASPLNRSFREWKLALSYAAEYRPTHLLLMYVDIFQLSMWLGQKAPCAVSGIYFRPDFHYAVRGGLKARLNVLRKKLTLRGVLFRGVLSNLFCLDHSAVPALTQMSPGVNVLPLPDPVKSYDISPAELDELRAELQLDPSRKTLLLFGHLDDRKGIEPLLEALRLVKPTVRQALSVLLVGSIKPDFRQLIEQKIADVPSDVQIIPVFKEIRGRRIQTYFELSDYALALYQRHVGMASVIIRAAVSRKPLLSSDYGYMGHLVQTEQLGLVADSTSPAAIASMLEQVIDGNVSYSEANLQKLADQNSDVAFAETILSRL
ncbi:hypothetical protein BN8_04572 [Fibrisoma limi BUZ 3]|uniref:Glycosyl transferase family 1 domain-containing protein n=1 Tax=Fibrisoma limi BUZ 3 TaxID=1185876 RepID=I2GN43_9BACT|nr:glycosyltransferase [Fibrisoma limi]CCH55321.1 hypothetical protein BN8_04572 [Fibrisoma limi BUZ 3]